MMRPKINDITDLQLEIQRLKNLKREQEVYFNDQYDLLKVKLTKPFQFMERIFSFLPGGSATKASVINTNDEDWLTRTLRIGLPFLVNRMFFRKAGYFKRFLMGVVSSQAAGFFNKERLAKGIDKLTALIKHSKVNKQEKKIRTQKEKEYNFGIPPDSETY